MHRVPAMLAIVFALVGAQPHPGAALADQGSVLLESAFQRARRASEVRDTLMRVTSAGRDIPSSVPQNVIRFLSDPYTGRGAPTLQELDSAQVLLNRAVPRSRQNEEGGGGGGTAVAAQAASLLTGGGTALPVLAAGATDFFVQRAKDEVAFAFLINLRNGVRDDKLIELAFPRSHGLMQRIDAETFQTLTPSLRSAFLSDLDELPSRADALITHLPGLRDETAAARRAEIRRYLEGIAIVYERGREIRQGVPPAVALANLVAVDAKKMSDDNTRRALRLVGLVAREYGAAGGEPMIRELTNRDRGWLRRYFVALLARDLIRIDVDSDSFPGSAAEQANAKTEAVDSVLNLLREREPDVLLLLNQIHALRGEIAALRSDAGQLADQLRANPEQLVTVAGAVLSVLRTAPRLAHLPTVNPDKVVLQFDSLMSEAAHLHQAVVQRDYATIVNWVAQNPRFRLCRDSEDGECRTRNRYLSLASALATANSAAEVTTALQAASSPVGSYRVKRSATGSWLNPRSVSVIGYLGAGRYETAGSDTIPGAVDGGLALPVGPELSFGAWWGAVSVFVPVLDLGPIANQAIGWNDSDTDAEIDTQELFAPGVGLVFNLTRGHAPLSLGAAVTSAYLDNGDQPGRRVRRTVVFFGVDATLFTFRF